MSPHNPIMEIHKKFSIPVACFVFALLGLALGASNRKDGKLASFVLGIGVIFVYYVIMFTAQAMTKGAGSRRGWRCGCRTSSSAARASFLLIRARARPISRSASRCRRGVTRRRRRATTAATGAGRGGAAPARVAPGRSSSAFRTSSCRARTCSTSTSRSIPADPRHDHRRHARAVLHLDVHRPVGQVVQGPDDARHARSSSWAGRRRSSWPTSSRIAVLLSALVTIGLLTKNSELIVMRACGISLYRTAVPLVVFALAAERGAVRDGGTRAGDGQPARRPAEAHHPRRVAADLRRAQSQVDRRHATARSITTSSTIRAGRELNGLSVFEFDPQTHALSRGAFVQHATYDRGRASRRGTASGR